MSMDVDNFDKLMYFQAFKSVECYKISINPSLQVAFRILHHHKEGPSSHLGNGYILGKDLCPCGGKLLFFLLKNAEKRG